MKCNLFSKKENRPEPKAVGLFSKKDRRNYSLMYPMFFGLEGSKVRLQIDATKP